MDGGAWWATVYRIAKSRTRLSNFTFTFTFCKHICYIKTTQVREEYSMFKSQFYVYLSFYHCITNFHKLSSLKQNKFIKSQLDYTTLPCCSHRNYNKGPCPCFYHCITNYLFNGSHLICCTHYP